MAGDDAVLAVDQHRVGEAKLADAAGDLRDLRIAVRPRVAHVNRPHYLAALERLPKGSAAKPRVSHVGPHSGGDAQYWCVTFADHHAEYQSSRHFSTKAEADDYASDFVVRLRGEINRP